MNATDDRNVAVVGLGLLGAALAERLLEAGFAVVVNNRTREKAAPLLAKGAIWSDNPLLECRRAVICLYTTEIVEQVLADLDAGLSSGTLLIDTTTGSPEQTAVLGQRLFERGVEYLESPIAASSEQTRRGEAVAFVAGRQEAFDSSADIFRAIAREAHFVGPWGAAATMKLVNNLVLGLTRAALAEGLVLAKEAGLDPAQTLEILKKGNAYSVVMDVKGEKMLHRDFTPQGKLSQHLKDVRLILSESARHGFSPPFSQLHQRLLEQAEQQGFGEQDNSAIIETLQGYQSSH